MAHQPLPIYADFPEKAAGLAAVIWPTGAARDNNRYTSLVMGGLVRIWLHAQANGQGEHHFVVGLGVGEADVISGVGGLVTAMIRRGWAKIVKNQMGEGLCFPGLKQFRKERRAAELDELFAADGATSKMAAFETFWQVYKPSERGSKGPKQPALREWLKIPDLDAALAREITAAAIRISKGGWKLLNGYSCHARRFIKDRMWKDAPPVSPGGGKPISHAQDGPPVADPGFMAGLVVPEAKAYQATFGEVMGPAKSIFGIIGKDATHGRTDPAGPTPAS